jgi:hypothetical protein
MCAPVAAILVWLLRKAQFWLYGVGCAARIVHRLPGGDDHASDVFRASASHGEMSSTTPVAVPRYGSNARSKVMIFKNADKRDREVGWPESVRVIVTDFDMPFGSLVRFLIKIGFASLLAALVLSMIFGAVPLLFWILVHGPH